MQRQAGPVSSGSDLTALRRSTGAWLRVYRLLAWLTQPKFTLGSLVVVRRPPAGEVLLVRQRLRTPSLWGLPGGFQKAGETAEEAGARELREEVGLDVPIRAADLTVSYQQPWARHLDSVFDVVLDAPTAARARRASFEILEVGWWPLERLPPLTREAALALQHLSD